MRIKWDQEEAVFLIDFYFKNGSSLKVSNEDISKLSSLLRSRAQKLNIPIDSKFRNESGIKMQLACIHSAVTHGQHGMPNASKLFYDTVALYQNNRPLFDQILSDFFDKYCN